MSAATNLTPDAPALPGPANQSISTLSVHADDKLNDLPPSLSQRVQDVAPALHVSTTYRFASNPDDLVEAKDADVSSDRNTAYIEDGEADMASVP